MEMTTDRDAAWAAFRDWSDATTAFKGAVLALAAEQPTKERKRELAQEVQRTLAAFVALEAA